MSLWLGSYIQNGGGRGEPEVNSLTLKEKKQVCLTFFSGAPVCWRFSKDLQLQVLGLEEGIETRRHSKLSSRSAAEHYRVGWDVLSGEVRLCTQRFEVWSTRVIVHTSTQQSVLKSPEIFHKRYSPACSTVHQCLVAYESIVALGHKNQWTPLPPFLQICYFHFNCNFLWELEGPYVLYFTNRAHTLLHFSILHTLAVTDFFSAQWEFGRGVKTPWKKVTCFLNSVAWEVVVLCTLGFTKI